MKFKDKFCQINWMLALECGVINTYSVLSAGSALMQFVSYGLAQFPLLSFACLSATKQHMAARKGQSAKLSTTASASE